jgi:hypothetical protein
MGYYGQSCSKESALSERLTDLSGYRSALLTEDFTLHWKSLEDSKQVEMVLRYR